MHDTDTFTDTFIVRADVNSSLSALWFVAALLVVSGMIIITASTALAAGGAVLGTGVLAMLLALTVQAVRFPRQ